MFQHVLDVPYLIQPTPITCQSTCLKMFAMYLERRFQVSSEGGSKSIEEIWKEINTGNDRPSKIRNSYENMKWWLGTYYCPIEFETVETNDVESAMVHIRSRIDAGFPVMVSTNHVRTAGHIILVVGYLRLLGSTCYDVEFICHDPYGKFDPQLLSAQYGNSRYEGASSLVTGSESGPGKSVIYNYEGIRRVRDDKHSTGKFFLISAKR